MRFKRPPGWFAHHKVLTAFAALAVLAVVFSLTSQGGDAHATKHPDATGSATVTSGAPPARPSPLVAATVKAGTALASLARLAEKGRAPQTGYDRARFGQAWLDVDRNGCDTRNDILRRDLTHLVLKADTNGCLVLTGTLHDPYTGKTIHFDRGETTSEAVQIDHVVSLSDAWQTGAQQLSLTEREEFANDPLNLLAVDGPANDTKSDGDAATWLPPNKSYRCAYVARQEAVKLKYHLWATPAEKAAIARVLAGCPTTRLPAAGPVPLGGGRTGLASTPSPGRSTSTGLDPRFATCAEANAHGYGPYYRGKDPEYDWYQDRDHDGIVCEK